MALTSTDTQRLERALVALATGDRALEVEFSDGSRVRYAGLKDVQNALDTARANVGQQQRRRSPVTQIRTGKGLGS